MVVQGGGSFGGAGRGTESSHKQLMGIKSLVF